MADVRADHSEAAMPGETILLEQVFGDGGQRLVVPRGPDRDFALLKSLRSPHRQLRERFYEVRAELRSTTNDPVLLTAHLRVENGTQPDKGTVVLHALIEPMKIILAMAEGSDLAIWRIDIAQTSTCWTVLQVDRPWALAAAAYRLDDKLVSMKLGRTKEGHLTVEVLEKLSGQHSLYEEVGEMSHKFKTVRQWKE